MKIALGCDHGGYELKEQIKTWLTEMGYEYEDFGCYSTASCDYPEFAAATARAVAGGSCEKGIVVCTTGIGISIAANKCKGIRAAVCSDTFSAKYTRLHNDTNVLCFGGRVVGPGLACMLVDAYLDAEFEGGRHQRRIDKMMALENK